ncbi:MAG: hypothetical protein HC923_09035, partial [Myxococcales bacterium]|nr:hypothetical protein [Myxococcales bacterium]
MSLSMPAAALLLLHAASPTWTVLPFEAPPDLREDVDTLRLLLETELLDRGARIQRTSGLAPCGEVDCARAALATA